MSDSGTNEQAIALGVIGAAVAVILATVVVVILLLGAILFASVQSTEEIVVHTPESTSEPSTAIPTIITPTVTSEVIEPVAVNAPSGRLVVVNNLGQLVTMAYDGSDRRELTDDTGSVLYSFPAWSPDGQSIAAIRQSDDVAQNGIVVLTDATDSEANILYSNDRSAPIYLFWSPDSERIAFIIGRNITNIDLNIVPRDASADSRLVATGAPMYWDWTADSEQIFFHSGTPLSDPRMTFVDLLSTYTTGNVDQPGFFQSPDVSADNRYVAYATFERGERQLIIADRDNDETTIIQHEGFVSLAWSPAAPQLAFIAPISARDRTSGPLRLTDPTGTVRPLTSENVFAFFWSPNGDYIAYLTLGLPLENNGEAALKATQRGRLQSNRLTFNLWAIAVATEERQLLGTFAPSDLFLSQFLPFFDQYARSHQIWSPDSRAVALPIRENERSVIYHFPLGDEIPTPLTDGLIAFWSHQ